MKTKTETKRGKRPTVGALRAPLAGSPAFVSVFVFVLIFGFLNFYFRNIWTPSSVHENILTRISPRENIFTRISPRENIVTRISLREYILRKKQSVSQMIDLLMTIRTVQESSKTKLSSGTFGHLKV